MNEELLKEIEKAANDDIHESFTVYPEMAQRYFIDGAKWMYNKLLQDKDDLVKNYSKLTGAKYNPKWRYSKE